LEQDGADADSHRGGVTLDDERFRPVREGENGAGNEGELEVVEGGLGRGPPGEGAATDRVVGEIVEGGGNASERLNELAVITTESQKTP
jgi:hypothetical protein